MKMKNITTMLVKGMLLVSFMYAGTVGPTLSMRFNDLLAVNNALPTPDVVLGLEASMGDGIFAGVESTKVCRSSCLNKAEPFPSKK